MLSIEQLKERKSGIGGSDAAAVAGIHPHDTAVDVYLDKITPAANEKEFSPDIQFKIEMGNELEDAVARVFAERNGVKIRRRNKLFRHKQYPWMIGNIDREIIGGSVLEVKTTGIEAALEQPLQHHIVQTMHYMEATGIHHAFIVYLIFTFGGINYRQYEVTHDEQTGEWLCEIENKFWNEHVIPRVPPAPSTVDDIAKLYVRVNNDRALIATPEIEALAIKLKSKKAELKALENEVQNLGNQVKMELEDSTLLMGLDGKPLATWRQNRDKVQTSWKDIADELMAEVDPADRDLLISSHTATNPGNRVFLVK